MFSRPVDGIVEAVASAAVVWVMAFLSASFHGENVFVTIPLEGEFMDMAPGLVAVPVFAVAHAVMTEYGAAYNGFINIVRREGFAMQDVGVAAHAIFFVHSSSRKLEAQNRLIGPCDVLEPAPWGHHL